MTLEDFKRLERKGVGFDDNKPLTLEQILKWQSINFSEFLTKPASGGLVTVKNQDNEVVETVTAPGQITVLSFTGIKDVPIAGNNAQVIDNPF